MRPGYLAKGDMPLAEWFNVHDYYLRVWGSKPAQALLRLATIATVHLDSSSEVSTD